MMMMMINTSVHGEYVHAVTRLRLAVQMPRCHDNVVPSSWQRSRCHDKPVAVDREPAVWVRLAVNAETKHRHYARASTISIDRKAALTTAILKCTQIYDHRQRSSAALL